MKIFGKNNSTRRAPRSVLPGLLLATMMLGLSSQVQAVGGDGLAELGDRVWEDLNANGIQDCSNTNGNGVVGDAGDSGPECDAGIDGVTATLLANFDPAGDPTCSGVNVVNTGIIEVTANGGFYLFPDLNPQFVYCVEFSNLPAGYSYTEQDQGTDDTLDSDPDTTTGRTVNIPLNPDESNLTIDAGVVRPASLGDRVWEDLNANGIQDCTDDNNNGILGDSGDSGPECNAGFPNVLVNLLDPGASGCASGDESIIDFRYTDGQGFYLFENLDPGQYCVEIIKPVNYDCTLDNMGADDEADSDFVDQGDGSCQTVDANQNPIDLESGENDPGWDAGLVIITSALGDRAWEDRNADGLQNCADTNGNGKLGDAGDVGDECDSGIPGIEVQLFTDIPGSPCGTGSMIGAPEYTDSEGFYLFENLPAGDYCVVFGETAIDFCDTNGYPLGAANFTESTLGTDDAINSDADSDGNTSGVALAAGETNRNIDAGYVCPAKIGNIVWEDTDENGLQEGSDTGIPGVIVDLYECGLDGIAGTADDVDTGEFRFTDANGMYMFGAEPGVYDLPPGSYYVKFNPASFPAGYDFTLPNQDGTVGLDSAIDSDCLSPDGLTTCTTLGSRGINLDRDCGLVPPPPVECDLAIDLQCRVEQQPTTIPGDKCSGKLKQFTLEWAGNGPVVITGVNMGSYDTTGTINVGDTVTFSGPYSSNDVVVSVTGADSGDSTFHVSCSDDNFNSEDDCGKLSGDGKNDDSSFLNLWKLRGFVDADDQVLNCSPSVVDGEFSQNCDLVEPAPASCETLGKPTSLTLKYTGGGCPGDNDQGDKSKCTGSVDFNFPVSIGVDTGEDYAVSPAFVNPDEEFTITRNNSDFRSNTVINLSNIGGTQVNEVHTSCSAPLAVGDEFGALTVVAINGETGGTEVTYQYTVTNYGSDLTGILVSDTPLGLADDYPAFDLASGDVETFTRTTSLTGTKVSVATASTTLAGQVCSASDQSNVEVPPPPPCVVTPKEPLIVLKGRDLKWKLKNMGTMPAVIERIEITWPASNGFIKKIRLDGDIVTDDIYATTVIISDFINEEKNRTIKVGDEKELKFEFKKDVSKSFADYQLKIVFEQGCEVIFDPDNLPPVPFKCSDAKPIDALSMIWNGESGVTVTSPNGDSVSNVQNGQEVTFDSLSGLGNNVYWAISGQGESVFHVSCSDGDMNGPEDCGNAQGDGKDDDADYLNLWLFEGMVGTNGMGLDCSELP